HGGDVLVRQMQGQVQFGEVCGGETVMQGLGQTRVLVRVDLQQAKRAAQFDQVVCGRDHDQARTVRVQDPVELLRVAGGENIEQYVHRGFAQGQALPYVGGHGTAALVGPSGSARRPLGDVHGQAGRVRQGLQHLGEVVAGTATDVDHQRGGLLQVLVQDLGQGTTDRVVVACLLETQPVGDHLLAVTGAGRGGAGEQGRVALPGDVEGVPVCTGKALLTEGEG